MIFSFDLLFCTDLVYCFGHFLWQATLIGAIYSIALGFVSKSRPEMRYRLGVFCLLGLACCVPITFLMQHDRSMVQSTSSTIGEQLSVEAAIKGGEINGGDALPPTLGSGSEILSSHDGGKANSTSRAQAFESILAPDANTGWFIDSISPWLVAAYWCCVSLLLLRLVIGVRAAHCYRRTSTPVTDNSLLELFQQAMQRVGISIAPPLRLCNQLLVPCVVGTFRPVIYLPVACATGLSPDQIEQILVHELAHIKRFDPLVNLFQNVVETLLFFHPVVWLVSRQVRLEREHCCDRFVLSSDNASGNSSGDYAKTLIDVATLGKAGRQSAVALAAAGNSRSELQQRIDRILGIGHTRPTRWVEAGSATLIATALVACLLMATQQNAVAQQSTEENTNQETSAQTEAAALDSLKAEEGKIVGVVVDTDGKPIEDALVDAWTWWKGTEVRTKPDGSFVLNPKDDDRERVEIRISKPGYSPYYNHLQLNGGQPQKFVLGNQTYLEGVVTDSEGKPVANAVVLGEQGEKRDGGYVISSVATETVTDAEGRYRLYVFPDTYDLKISSPNQGVARLSEVTVAEDEGKKLDFQLSPGVRFEAEVVDSQSGKPVEGFVLWSWLQPEFIGISDANGKIVIDSMQPGEFEFQAGGGKPIKIGVIEGYQHGPFGRWWSDDATTQWGREETDQTSFQRNIDGLSFDLSVGMDPVKIEVERGVVFTGKVFDPDGNPVAGAIVAPALTGSGNSLTGDTRYSETTKADGSYRVVMPAGNHFQYNLMAHDGEYKQWRNWANAVTDPIESHPGDTIEKDITLNRPATVKGRVVATAGRKVKGLKVRAAAADLRGNRYYDPTVATVDEDGNFELKFIRPGKHFIQVEPFWLSPADGPGESTAIVELEEGETKEGIELKVSE